MIWFAIIAFIFAVYVIYNTVSYGFDLEEILCSGLMAALACIPALLFGLIGTARQGGYPEPVKTYEVYEVYEGSDNIVVTMNTDKGKYKKDIDRDRCEIYFVDSLKDQKLEEVKYESRNGVFTIDLGTMKTEYTLYIYDNEKIKEGS